MTTLGQTQPPKRNFEEMIKTLVIALCASVWATSVFGASQAHSSIYCDEQSTKRESKYCWARGGDPRPGGRVDRCISALPEDMQFFKKVELCVETKSKSR